jgi:predicted NUDIX family NTP pyrophosphohydrolase
METQMVTSCGVLVKHAGKYILGHATGRIHFDIFKGRMDEGETYLQTALRECQEESGLIFTGEAIHDLGLHDYIKNKMLYLYIGKLEELDMSTMACSTYFDNNILEMDYYESFEFDEMLTKIGKNMRRIFLSLKDTIEAY